MTPLEIIDHSGCSEFSKDGGAGAIAVIKRGECAFSTKAVNAEKAGFAALIVVDRDGEELTPPGMGEAGITIPVVMVAAASAPELSTAGATFAIQVGDHDKSLLEKPQDIQRLVSSSSGGGRRKATVPGVDYWLDRVCFEHHQANPRTAPIRAVEGLMLNNELDMLLLHLQELYSVMDAFVIVESTQTHQGKEKPLYFFENREQFAPYLDKIVLVVIESFPMECIARCRCENFQVRAATRETHPM
jgi:hypothetical protein